VFQTDLYGLIGTVHVLLFGEYMNVKYTECFKSRWEAVLRFNRFVSFYGYYVGLSGIGELASKGAMRHLSGVSE